MVEKQFTVTDKAGIHARPAAMLVSVANKFVSDVNLDFGGKNVNLKSILGVMSLGIGHGETFKLNANGADEQDAINELAKTLKTEGLAE
ncbi:phosphocarrier protein HPr [Sporosarcina beigongshangi]|uniref:phosphocarrier protein HPr n=1 Tax=Sporosarcina beigongshangi TaxID=2782538 RepID=UPI00193AAD75|nr:phosphocarrier protein HPr [Sporosarcina beigongshangi]